MTRAVVASLLVLMVAGAVVSLLGCGADKPVPPIVIPGYEQSAVRTVFVSVTTTSPHHDDLGRIVRSSLKDMGLKPADSASNADASLVFSLDSEVYSAVYSGNGGYQGRQYSGVGLSGEVRLEAPGRVDGEGEIWWVSSEIVPPDQMINVDYSSAEDAPFAAAFAAPMLESLAYVWGPEAVVDSIRVWFPYTNMEGVTDWLVSAGATIVPRLLEMRLEKATSNEAYPTLGEMFDLDAIPPEYQSVVVRALISDLTGPHAESADSTLWGIAYTVSGSFDQTGWDIDQWTAWAESNGF